MHQHYLLSTQHQVCSDNLLVAVAGRSAHCDKPDRKGTSCLSICSEWKDDYWCRNNYYLKRCVPLYDQWRVWHVARK